MKKDERISKLVELFFKTDTSDFPDIYRLGNPLDLSLWVLWVAKDNLKIDSLNTKEIATILTKVFEIDADEISISRALVRAGKKVHREKTGDVVYYSIMREGKMHLSPIAGRGINVHYIAPGTEYSGKMLLIEKVLGGLKGEIRLSDPYLGERTLDILRRIANKKIMVLTRLRNLREEQKKPLLRELKDFTKEFKTIEFRDHFGEELHDRYIISENFLCILGHSLKDLGSKEAFVIALENQICKDIKETLLATFNRRWKQATKIS